MSEAINQHSEITSINWLTNLLLQPQTGDGSGEGTYGKQHYKMSLDLIRQCFIEVDNVVNNLTTSIPGYVADARQLTALKTLIDAITAKYGVADGLATLDSDGLIPSSQIPSIALVDVYTVASEALMLALDAEQGDMAIRTDTNQVFILSASPATTLDNWLELSALKALVDLRVPYTGATGNVDIGEHDMTAQKYISKYQKLFAQYVTNTTDEILTHKNVDPSAVHTIFELRSPDTATAESTLSLHNVVEGLDEWVRDVSMNNYSGSTKASDVLSHFTGTDAGQWLWVTRYTDGTDYSMVERSIMVLDGDTGYLLVGEPLETEEADPQARLDIRQHGYLGKPALMITMDSSHEDAPPAIYCKNDSNYAMSGALVKFSLVNATDTATVLKLENEGTGNSIEAPNFAVAKNGEITSPSITEILSIQNIKLENDLKNGDFSDEYTNWETVGGVTSKGIVDNELSITYGSAGGLRTPISYSVGDVICAFTRAKVDSSSHAFALILSGIDSSPELTTSSTEYTNLCSVHEVLTDGSGYAYLRSALGTVTIDLTYGVQTLNLTDIFGKGYEPSSYFMEKVLDKIGYIDGSHTMTNKEILQVVDEIAEENNNSITENTTNISENTASIESIEELENYPFTVYYDTLKYFKSLEIYSDDYSKFALTLFRYNLYSHYPIIQISAYNGYSWEVFAIYDRITAPTKTVETLTVDGKFSAIIDWTGLPTTVEQTISTLIKSECITGCVSQNQLEESETLIDTKLPTDGYAIKDTITNVITVDSNGNGDFLTIESAYASITDSSIYNQYEVVVFAGTYNENNLIVPAYTHTHGIRPESVIITSYGLDTTYPVLDQRFTSSKLSNLTVISYTKYCVHYDYSLDSQTVMNENLHLIQTKTANGTIIGGGTFTKGTLYIWNNCIFEGGEVHCHTAGSQGDFHNTHNIFNKCKLINAYFYAQSTGGFGHCVYEINDCYTKKGNLTLQLATSPLRIADEPYSYFTDVNEWQVLGANNKNFRVDFLSEGEGLMFETANIGEDITISGTAIASLFGVVKYKLGGTRLKGMALGIYYVKDTQAGLDPYTELADVYQMWKRLGDCSTTNKTLSVTVGSTTQTYTFDQDYSTLETSEDTLMAAINSTITIATIQKNVLTELWNGINVEEKQFITVSDANDVLKGCAVGIDGANSPENSTSDDVFGIALDDGSTGETIPVWVGNMLTTTLADGEYGVGTYGELVTTATEKICKVESGVLYKY
jgi:hypothetical protein